MEKALVFGCAGERSIAVLHQPAARVHQRGFVLVVGGPQYRVGSHRQFILLARRLALGGYPVLRFDYRGMGDGGGEARDFEQVGEDIRAAIDLLVAECPDVKDVVLWGLCDAASANALYAVGDARVRAQVALNPWVRTVAGEARAYLRHYYLQRLMSADFWRKVLRLDWGLRASVADLWRKARRARNGAGESADGQPQEALPDRMRRGFAAFSGPVLLVLSGNDLTAREFDDTVAASPQWRRWVAAERVRVHRIEAADHTFSCRAWRDEVADITLNWVGSW